MEHVFQIGPWILPGCDSVTKENEIVDHARGVDADHLAHAAEGRILLVIVAYITQTCAPRPNKLIQRWRDFSWADQSHPPCNIELETIRFMFKGKRQTL